MIARVFPRRTMATPTDEHAYVGGPPLWADKYERALVSVTFTWDLERGRQLQKEWSTYCPTQLGGPAVRGDAGPFQPGLFLAPGYVITSRGCPKRCPWCVVPKREGRIRELPIADGWRVQDNNLLACSRPHIEAVFEMLRQQPLAVSFPGGLHVDYLAEWHIDQIKTVRSGVVFVAADTPAAIDKLDKAADLLADIPLSRRMCYVLIGYDGDTIADAQRRCEAVYEKGFLPFAMLFRDEAATPRSVDWKRVQRNWCRPAIYRRSQKG